MYERLGVRKDGSELWSQKIKVVVIPVQQSWVGGALTGCRS